MSGNQEVASGLTRQGVGAPRYDRALGVPEMVRGHAEQRPEAIAIICDDVRLTYGELDRISDGLATYLVSCGVAKGDVVCLLVPRSLETVVAKLAILKAGAGYLPLDPSYPADHLRYVLEECRPKVVFTMGNPALVPLELQASGSRPVDLPTLLRNLSPGDVSQLPRSEGADLAYVMYTSGSTGRPKGVAVPHRGITRLVLEQNFIKYRPGDMVLHATTISFDASTLDIWGALLNGATLVVMSKPSFSLADVREMIKARHVTKVTFTTGLFNVFADHAEEQMPSLRQIIFGGEVASAPHVKRFIKAHPACILTNAYGPTEAACIATTFTVPADFSASELPIGKPICNTEVLLLDEGLRVVPPGVEGQIAIAGDGLALGYFNRPDLTAERFVTIDTGEGERRCYLTGDLAVMEEDGTFHFRGRRDRQVKINGKRIELEEIEAALRRHPRLAEAVVECRETGGVKRIIAYLRPNKPQDLSNANLIPSVMERLRSSLPAYMIPSTALVMAQFPLTKAGKIDRARLPLPPIEDTHPAIARSRSEEILTRLWSQALGIETVPIDRNFFDLGGTSLQLMRIHAGLELELGQRCEVLALFKHPTVRDMALFLDGREAPSSRAAEVDWRAAMQRRTMSQFRRSTP
ncbi:amino acid adenylation domain-containing protein [Pseudorhizobium tarimense]|uniref:Amino acid adenylation domain-containing protein n=1 Tax=Pseudorhizobium tarimense TaxID=1079109 RepID=A0ABV2H4A9_9HYPH|nr:non-ribosomal peptide synthetase [Pseudorhizobium tarimense]MCJ8518619.1 non-ribosomal peptide synthetase [Pseudorhizobium tarimense]